MQLRTMPDVGVCVRERRQQRGWTQAEFADRVGVSRAWVVRLEKGAPRLEAYLVLDALAALGASLTVSEAQAQASDSDDDPFTHVFQGLGS